MRLGVHEPDVALRIGIALFRRQAISAGCLGMVPAPVGKPLSKYCRPAIAYTKMGREKPKYMKGATGHKSPGISLRQSPALWAGMPGAAVQENLIPCRVNAMSARLREIGSW